MNEQPEWLEGAPVVITKDEAKASRLPHYFTGVPCSNRHIAARRVHGSKCEKCIADILAVKKAAHSARIEMRASMKASLRPIVELEVRRRLAREELKARVKADALALKVAELKALKAAPKAGKAKVVKANAKPVKPVKPKAAPVKVTVATVGATAKVTAKVTANVNSNAAAQTLQAASEGLSNYMGYEFFDNE